MNKIATIFGLLVAFILGCVAYADSFLPDTTGIARKSDLDAMRTVLPGTYTLTTLPPASAWQAHYAFVTDLGGGADMVLSDGAYWKRIRRGSLVNIPAATHSVNLLRTGSVLALPASLLNSNIQISIETENLYPGAEFTVINSGTLGALAGIGIGLAGSPTSAFLPLLGQRWVDYIYDGTTLRVVRTGGLL